MAPELVNLPEDGEALKAMVRSLLLERDRETQRAEEQQRRAEDQQRRAEESQRQAEELRVEMLRLQLELERYKKWYYGPRADRLQSSGDVAQMLLEFAGELDRKPVHPDDVPPIAEPAEELRRVRRPKGRRNLANFENLPVTTHVHELSAQERACPGCGAPRQQIGADESWRSNIMPPGSSASSTCARSTPVRTAKAKVAAPRSRRRRSRNPRSIKGWPGRDC